MRISDWSSDVCSSDLQPSEHFRADVSAVLPQFCQHPGHLLHVVQDDEVGYQLVVTHDLALLVLDVLGDDAFAAEERPFDRSEEHTSELQSLMRISYAVFCLKKKHNTTMTMLITTTKVN